MRQNVHMFSYVTVSAVQPTPSGHAWLALPLSFTLENLPFPTQSLRNQVKIKIFIFSCFLAVWLSNLLHPIFIFIFLKKGQT